jgi:hypothetical protein
VREEAIEGEREDGREARGRRRVSEEETGGRRDEGQNSRNRAHFWTRGKLEAMLRKWARCLFARQGRQMGTRGELGPERLLRTPSQEDVLGVKVCAVDDYVESLEMYLKQMAT